MGWNIKIEPLISGDYVLDYVESYPNTELHMRRIKATKDLVSQHPMFANNVEMVEKDRNIELHFKYIGKKQAIVDMIASEFLSFSGIGKKTLQDLFVNSFLDSLIASRNVSLLPGSHGMLSGTSDVNKIKIGKVDSNEQDTIID